MKPLILIYSQDPEFFLVFSHILNADGFASTLAGSAEEAFRLAAGSKPQAVILDCQGQDDAAAGLCARLKGDEATRGILVVALIAAKAGHLHLALLKAGIDESFTRPFAPAKLLAHLRATLAFGDAERNDETELRHGAIALNPKTHRVHVNGKEVHLPPIEFRLLQHLLQAQGEVCSRVELMKAGWRQDAAAELRGVDTHIARLRKFLMAALKTDMIRTVRSVGYALKDSEPDNTSADEPSA